MCLHQTKNLKVAQRIVGIGKKPQTNAWDHHNKHRDTKWTKTGWMRHLHYGEKF